MQVHAVFVHRWQPRTVLQAAPGDYYTVQTPSRYDIRLADELSGELSRVNVRWLLNENRQTVICIEVIGRYPSIESAIDATQSPYFISRGQRAPHLERATIGSMPIVAGPTSRRLRTLH